MNRILRPPSAATLLAALVLMGPASLLAQDNDDLDVTMRMVVDDAELADKVIQELQLPEPQTATLPDDDNEQRRGRVDDLREQGRALGRDISEEARSRREERSPGGAGNAPEFPPENPPDRGDNDRPAPGMGGRP